MFWSSTLLFAATIFVGLAAAYDPSLGIERFVLLISGLVIMSMLVKAGRNGTATLIGVSSVIFAFMAGAISLFFLIDADSFGDSGQKYLLLNQIDAHVKSILPELLLPGKIHSSAAAGALIILVPLGFAAIPWLKNSTIGRWILPLVLINLAIASIVIGLTGERSAWISLLLGSLVGLYLHWRFGPGQVTRMRWLGDGLLWASITLAGFAFFVILTQPGYGLSIGGVSIGGSVISRTELWQEAMVMIEDYLFTGSGLGSTAMVFSTYLFLLHVPFLYHAYNVILQIAIEQGAPGAIGFVFMILSAGIGLVSAYRSAYPQRQTLESGSYLHTVCSLTATALVAMMIHGMVDAGVYVSTLVPVMFFPLAFAMMLPQGAPLPKRRGFHEQKAYQYVATGLPIAAVFALFLVPGLTAATHANLGTFQQTRVELSEYTWPEWPIQDALRREGKVRLERSQNHYHTALESNPTNTTAHRRLGQIALSMGDYDLARQHLEMAYATSPEQRVTRQLLGEVYAAQGDVDAATQLWETVPVAFRRHLSVRQWWYTHLNAQAESIWLEESITALRN